MKKAWITAGILAALGILIAVIAGFSQKAVAEDHQNHCICGGTSDCIASVKTYGHEGDASKGRTEVTWTAASSSDEFFAEISRAYSASETEAYIYLADSFTLSKGISNGIAHGMHIYICLNGQTLTKKASDRLFTAYLQNIQSEIYLHKRVCRHTIILLSAASAS